VDAVRSVDLAVYADQLAGEAAALAARAERLRSRLRQASIEREARRELPRGTIVELESLGLVAARDERALRSELGDLDQALEAVERLQAWVEGKLALLHDNGFPVE
jgi:hypothetical protein